MTSKHELFQDISSNGNLFQTDAFGRLAVTFNSLEQGLHPSANSFDLATVFTINSGTFADVNQQLFPGSLAGKTVTFGAWLRSPNSGSPQFFITTKTHDSTFAVTNLNPVVNSLTLIRVVHTFSAGFTDSGFGTILRINGQDSGDTVVYWRQHVAIGEPIEILEVFPEFDFKQRDRKIENTHITRSGAKYVYKWGEQWRAKFGVRYVNSEDTWVVNSWWDDNAKLMWFADCGADVRSVQLVNRTLPISKIELPYHDEYEGTIELETY